MTKYAFLSESWFTAVEALLAEEEFAAPVTTAMVVNLIVEETPFGDDVRVFVGAIEGRAQWGHGHREDADLVLATDYGTAKDIFISGDPMSGMSAFFAGKVRLQGDLTKLAEAAASAGGPAGALGFTDPEMTEKLQSITEL
jgi:putative sterol carrier protein